MARILRGDIVWADLNPVKGHEQAGLRPVLILSPEIFNDRSGTVIAMALTSQPQRAGFPLALELTSVALPKPTWVKISQIRTLSVERIGKRIWQNECGGTVEGLTSWSTGEDFASLGRWIHASGLPAAAVLEGGYSDELPQLIEAFLVAWAGKD